MAFIALVIFHRRVLNARADTEHWKVKAAELEAHLKQLSNVNPAVLQQQVGLRQGTAA